MNYLSLGFAVFVLATFLLYYILPKKLRGGVLLISSLFFYGSFNVKSLIFLLFSALTTFVVARLLSRFKKKWIVIGACIAANAAIWYAIKVLPWTLSVLEWLFTI